MVSQNDGDEERIRSKIKGGTVRLAWESYVQKHHMAGHIDRRVYMKRHVVKLRSSNKVNVFRWPVVNPVSVWGKGLYDKIAWEQVVIKYQCATEMEI